MMYDVMYKSCLLVHVHVCVCVCVCAGEKLSKQELQSNGIIKKLRQKDKQNDQLLAAQRYICTCTWLRLYMYSYVDHIVIAANFQYTFIFIFTTCTDNRLKILRAK